MFFFFFIQILDISHCLIYILIFLSLNELFLNALWIWFSGNKFIQFVLSFKRLFWKELRIFVNTLQFYVLRSQKYTYTHTNKDKHTNIHIHAQFRGNRSFLSLFLTFSSFIQCFSYHESWSHSFPHPFASTLCPSKHPPK